MKHIFSQHEHPEPSSIPGIPVSFAGSLIGPTTVGNYAEVLRRNLTPTSIDLTQNTHNSGSKLRRRTQIPIYTGNSTAISAETKTRTRKSDSTATTHNSPTSISTISPTTTDKLDTHFNNRLAKWETDMENNLNERFRKFENEQKEKFLQFEAKLNQTIDSLLSSAAEKFQQSIQPQLEMMTNNMLQMQNKVMSQLNSLTYPSKMSASGRSSHSSPPPIYTNVPVAKSVQFSPSTNNNPHHPDPTAHSSLGGTPK